MAETYFQMTKEGSVEQRFRGVKLRTNFEQFLTTCALLLYVQEKYVYVHVSDAGPKCVDLTVPKAFKGRRQEFFSQANKHFATATGIVHVVEGSRRKNSVMS